MKYLSMYKFVFFANVFNKLRNNLNASVFFKDWTLMTLKSYNNKNIYANETVFNDAC